LGEGFVDIGFGVAEIDHGVDGLINQFFHCFCPWGLRVGSVGGREKKNALNKSRTFLKIGGD